MRIPVYRLFWVLIVIVVCILAIYTFTVLSGHFLTESLPKFLIERFDINGEANIPTWYSTVLLFSISAASFLIYGLALRLPKASRPLHAIWLIFGAMYAFFSLDEAAMIHELIDQLTTVKWIYIYAPVVGSFFLASLYYFMVVRRNDRVLRNWVVGGLIVFAFGGIVCEWFAHTFYLAYAMRQVEYVVEEGSEMIGTVMVLTGCLLEFNHVFEKVFSEASGSTDQRRTDGDQSR